MYRNMIIAETGDIQRALDHLESACKQNLDRLTYLESRAKYLAQLGKKEEAVQAYRTLLDRNPDRTEYYGSLIAVMDIPEGDIAARKAVYDEYVEKFPRSHAARRLSMDFLTGMPIRTHPRAHGPWTEY